MIALKQRLLAKVSPEPMSGCDMCAKGRDRHPRGTSSGLAKLSPESVAAIRLLRGKMSQARIAAAWGIAKSNVWSIQHGRTWVEGSR